MVGGGTRYDTFPSYTSIQQSNNTKKGLAAQKICAPANGYYGTKQDPSAKVTYSLCDMVVVWTSFVLAITEFSKKFLSSSLFDRTSLSRKNFYIRVHIL